MTCLVVLTTLGFEETVTTASGYVSLLTLMPFAAGAYFVRAIGCAYAERRNDTAMAWAPRILSWALLSVVGILLGLTGSAAAIAALGAFIVLDAAGAFAKQAPTEPVPRRKRRRGSIWARTKLPLLTMLYLTLTAIVHITVSVYLPFGTLVTWSMLALGFGLLLRFTLAGPKAHENDMRAPQDHRRHQRREETIPDPQRQHADIVLRDLRATGDAKPILDIILQAARAAELPENEIAELERRVNATFTRAGTRRDDDLHAALAEIETRLTLNRREVTP